MDGNLLARRIVAIAVKEKVNGSKGFFFNANSLLT